MKAALLIVLSLSALAYAGPAFNKDNQIDQQSANKKIGGNDYYQQQQQQQYMTGNDAKGPAIDVLKQWCFSSQMSQQELTASFKKLVGVVKSQPSDQTTEQAVMTERVCQGAIVQKSQQSGETVAQTGVDAQAHELIKDVYMDALISCKSRECTQQLVKIINSNKIDTIRASYYMTRIAVTEKDSIKDDQEIKTFADSFIQTESSSSDAIERQKLFAVTSLLAKAIKQKPTEGQLKQTIEQVAKTIVERYIKPVGQDEVQQYHGEQQPSQQIAKKIAKRNAALQALANLPGHILKESEGVQTTLVQLIENKQELVTVRQSAIECLEQNESALELLKKITFDQEEPIEVRVAAYRALMTVAYAGETKEESQKKQIAADIIQQIMKHCEDQRNQQQDDQFVLYAISHLDNIRTSQRPEHQAIKKCIEENKQHYMQIQVLCKKFKQQLSDVRRSSRNYKLEQEFNQLDSGLVIEGDLIYESKQHQRQQQQILPRLVRVNMSMPVMGETVNVVEITLRQNQMDEELLSVLKLAQNTKFNSGSVSKVVDSFKSSVERQQQQQNQYQRNQQQAVEGDMIVKVDGCTVVYLCMDDFKSATNAATGHHQRNTRSIYSAESIVEDIIAYLKRQPIAFNRGFNFNINERLAKVLDVDANVIAGLRFESRAQGHAEDFEIVAHMEPRFSFEAIVGPAKVSDKKLLQRVSTKSAIGMRYRFKKNELADIQIDLPMNTMELFTFETQMVEKNTKMPGSYTYLPESIYGQADIYTVSPFYYQQLAYNKLVKRSIIDFGTKKQSTLGKLFSGKTFGKTYKQQFETPDEVARATGLRGKLRFVVAPKDMSFLVSAVVEKEEPSMKGFRVQVQKVERNQELKQYQLTFSTPNSRVDRTMQVRVSQQSTSQRTVLKADVQSPKMTGSVLFELVHDGRQYALKTEIVSRNSRQQWRHMAEGGLMRSSQSATGRIAATYKPYINIESSALKRPIQLQGTISYQQSPKTVISYELKCPTSGDYVQGKLIVDQRDSSQAMRKRSSISLRRSMQSPIELLATKDLTITNEIIGQVRQHAVKVHKMIDWDSSKYAIQGDFSASYKNMRKQTESQLMANLKLDAEQQVFTVTRKSPQQQDKEYRVQITSQCRQSSHQLVAECHYNGRRQSLVAYKHKVDFVKMSPNKFDYTMQVELVDTERQINEKLQGRARVANERKMKAVQVEMSAGRSKLAKVNVEFESLEQHQIQVIVQTERMSHKTELRATQRQFTCQSRTDKHGQMLAKMALEISKQYPTECQFVFEVPSKRAHVAVDLKLASGKLSSIAVQTPRFASKGEFAFETISRPLFGSSSSSLLRSFVPQVFGEKSANLRFKSHLKDLIKKEAYWMESALNAADWDKKSSYLRLDSPIYRTDLEFDPRESHAKFGMFARNKRSIDNYDSIYSQKDSALSSFLDAAVSGKLNLGQNKLWMIRSIINSPSTVESLKQKARRALFEYADRRQSHKHQMQYSPIEERLNFQFEHQPNTEFVSQSTFVPLRMTGDWSTSFERPSTMSLESDYMNFDLDTKPFDGEEAYAKISALSRNRRSPFKKHESELRYKKGEGYKAWMKHDDSKNKRHSWQLEADESPKKWTKMSYENEKHGKTNWEHKWRKHVSKRASDQEDVYANMINFRSQVPDNKWSHDTTFEWDEPIKMVQRRQERLRERRSIADDWSLLPASKRVQQTGFYARYSPVEYLKHTSARLNSQTSRGFGPVADLYKVDFDYQPQMNAARLNVKLPEELMHTSSFEMKPAERLYKLQSKLYNARTNEPSYELHASTKPYGLATAEQEPMFVNLQHEMLERPLTNSIVSSILRQPMKLDYSDKYGRVATFDYDQSPIMSNRYTGLRQKRAAIYYKDQEADFEHSSDVDFYPETVFGKLKPSYKRQSGDVAIKAQTKYGPVVLRTDSNENTFECELESPLVDAKISAEQAGSRQSTKLVKVTIDNKSQKLPLVKLLRKVPVIGESEKVMKFARKFDSRRFSHQSEMLVSFVEAIFKVKSETQLDSRPILVIEGEYNQQQEKAFAKINGERVKGQLIVDLVNKSANLFMDVDDKRTFQQVTRLERVNEKFYTLDSMTTYKSKPVFKLSGKVSSMIFEEPSHLFASHRKMSKSFDAREPHVSTFEAVLYEPKEYHITGHYDCLNKEARIVSKSIEENKIQETIVKYDEQSENMHVDARLSSPYTGQVYVSKAKLNLPSLFAGKCHYGARQSCQSEIVYQDKSGNWAAKYVPNEYVSIVTPSSRQTINLSY